MTPKCHRSALSRDWLEFFRGEKWHTWLFHLHPKDIWTICPRSYNHCIHRQHNAPLCSTLVTAMNINIVITCRTMVHLFHRRLCHKIGEKHVNTPSMLTVEQCAKIVASIVFCFVLGFISECEKERRQGAHRKWQRKKKKKKIMQSCEFTEKCFRSSHMFKVFVAFLFLRHLTEIICCLNSPLTAENEPKNIYSEPKNMCYSLCTFRAKSVFHVHIFFFFFNILTMHPSEGWTMKSSKRGFSQMLC